MHYLLFRSAMAYPLSHVVNSPLSTLPKSGRLSCEYPMAYKGLTDRELNLSVHIFICRSSRFYKKVLVA